eukprot:5396110-Amphidinium_carterae.1
MNTPTVKTVQPKISPEINFKTAMGLFLELNVKKANSQQFQDVYLQFHFVGILLRFWRGRGRRRVSKRLAVFMRHTATHTPQSLVNQQTPRINRETTAPTKAIQHPKLTTSETTKRGGHSFRGSAM